MLVDDKAESWMESSVGYGCDKGRLSECECLEYAKDVDERRGARSWQEVGDETCISKDGPGPRSVIGAGTMHQ